MRPGSTSSWKNIQQEILLSCGFQYTANAGAAVSKGGEMEMRARPTDPLEMSLGLGYQNAKITETGSASPQTGGLARLSGAGLDRQRRGVVHDSADSTEWKMISGTDYSYIGRSYSGNNMPADPRLRPPTG